MRVYVCACAYVACAIMSVCDNAKKGKRARKTIEGKNVENACANNSESECMMMEQCIIIV